MQRELGALLLCVGVGILFLRGIALPYSLRRTCRTESLLFTKCFFGPQVPWWPMFMSTSLAVNHKGPREYERKHVGAKLSAMVMRLKEPSEQLSASGSTPSCPGYSAAWPAANATAVPAWRGVSSLWLLAGPANNNNKDQTEQVNSVSPNNISKRFPIDLVFPVTLFSEVIISTTSWEAL
ncbi:conserved hypothetical protein [Histoplasma capsulatum var. duboisii H88]|uniref:Uncharacterized protein n=2 Tax=Ajellomyces capsulatus TaxID=5037 RepID=F0ULD2_AJEC8|nr:conserved hypothetical protein [Histoplasma capsulatum H143]EGC46202.1 conserved hypothetical protein [Histoplasma capsulatum var. duboisii H88]